MGRFSVITLTQAAQNRVVEIMENNNVHGIIIGVKKGGCAGMEYTVDLATTDIKNADIVEFDRARVYIAREAVLFLLGTQMDYEIGTLRTGFVFNNPNQTSACGCGESVEIRPASQSALENVTSST
ncbi:iron-sulfur cluster assembly accessory protein [Bartonella tamiae]|uniref:Iron-sulfur cluster assembly accessory protein n=1 Tax=Bartonella tamiae Th239 TaxID=1094558 RepID=J0QSG4_9HYPH|nr:iron-sulfur cluster assembly accessory protein [Bartonella tamiae]EJF88806.1 iron-sulfur cluster assembly accessory protein [Bartonella tamiae Th239]EJF94944.1 iron-sulfur cluster assembly accessory protein [Bartonella tamiae Th307]